MKGSGFIAVLCSGNYKVSNCYEVLLKEWHIPSMLVMLVKFFFQPFFDKFLKKVRQKDYFEYMKGSKFIAVLFF